MSKLRPVTPISIIAALLSDVMSDPSISSLKNSKVWKDLERAKELANGLDPYLERNTSSESEVLKSLKQKTLDFDWQDRTGREFVNGLEPEMLSGHVEGQFLKLMVAISGAERILEIGVFSGYSVLAMAEALPEGGVLVACELDPRAAKFAMDQLQAAGFGGKVRLELGPALASLETLAKDSEKFDLVFVDADKPSYREYVKYMLDHGLVEVGGVFLIDNPLLQGEVYLGEEDRGVAAAAIHDFNDYLTNEPRIEQVLIPLRDGVTLARRVI